MSKPPSEPSSPPTMSKPPSKVDAEAVIAAAAEAAAAEAVVEAGAAAAAEAEGIAAAEAVAAEVAPASKEMHGWLGPLRELEIPGLSVIGGNLQHGMRQNKNQHNNKQHIVLFTCSNISHKFPGIEIAQVWGNIYMCSNWFQINSM